MENPLPSIPPKRYFTIGEVSELCRVKPYVLRYWEQEFTQLKPLKRRGNRRYYQHHEVLLIRRIRELLYEHGFTINGARNRLEEPAGSTPPLTAATSALLGSGRARNTGAVLASSCTNTPSGTNVWKCTFSSAAEPKRCTAVTAPGCATFIVRNPSSALATRRR